MPIVIRKSDGTNLVTIQDSQVDTGASSLALFGRGASDYVSQLNENLVRLLENSRNTTPPTNPILGQLWFKDEGFLRQKLNVRTNLGWTPVLTESLHAGIVPIDLQVSGGSVAGNVGITLFLSSSGIVGAVSAYNIEASQLPEQQFVAHDTIPFRSRFPNGLKAGLTLAQGYGLNGQVPGSTTPTTNTNTNTNTAHSLTLRGDLVGGDGGTGTLNASLVNSGVRAGTYGSATSIPIITVDAKGRVTSASTVSGRLGFPSTGVTPGTYGSGTRIPVINIGADGRILTASTVPAPNSPGTGTLSNTGVTPGIYGSSITVPVFRVDAQGRIISSTNTPISITQAALPNSGVVAGRYGNATAYPSITVDAKGRVTNVTTITANTGNAGVAAVRAELPPHNGNSFPTPVVLFLSDDNNLVGLISPSEYPSASIPDRITVNGRQLILKANFPTIDAGFNAQNTNRFDGLNALARNTQVNRLILVDRSRDGYTNTLGVFLGGTLVAIFSDVAIANSDMQFMELPASTADSFPDGIVKGLTLASDFSFSGMSGGGGGTTAPIFNLAITAAMGQYENTNQLRFTNSDSFDVTDEGSSTVSIDLSSTGVTPGTYGSGSVVPQITVDEKGRIRSIEEIEMDDSGAIAGIYGSETEIPKITVDAKGRITEVMSVPAASELGFIVPMPQRDGQDTSVTVINVGGFPGAILSRFDYSAEEVPETAVDMSKGASVQIRAYFPDGLTRGLNVAVNL